MSKEQSDEGDKWKVLMLWVLKASHQIQVKIFVCYQLSTDLNIHAFLFQMPFQNLAVTNPTFFLKHL